MPGYMLLRNNTLTLLADDSESFRKVAMALQLLGGAISKDLYARVCEPRQS